MDAGGVSHYKLSLSTSAPFKDVDRDILSQVRSLLRQKTILRLRSGWRHTGRSRSVINIEIPMHKFDN